MLKRNILRSPMNGTISVEFCFFLSSNGESRVTMIGGRKSVHETFKRNMDLLADFSCSVQLFSSKAKRLNSLNLPFHEIRAKKFNIRSREFQLNFYHSDFTGFRIRQPPDSLHVPFIITS